jgi:hypothetical protein
LRAAELPERSSPTGKAPGLLGVHGARIPMASEKIEAWRLARCGQCPRSKNMEMWRGRQDCTGLAVTHRF